MSDQLALFDGHHPDYYRHPALWPTVDPDDIGLDDQARWLWPDLDTDHEPEGLETWT